MKTALPQINRVVFKTFLLTVFFVYYQTKFLPGTLHTWLMMFGLVLTIPSLLRRYAAADLRVPLDYFLIFILLLIIVAGFLANFPTTTWLDFQAYVLMLLTYVYVKENATGDTSEFLSFVVKSFLLINGILVILQLLTGRYFPAAFLADGDPPLIIASGVSDGPTKNGMLISFALSFMYARLIFRQISFSWVDTLIFLVGLASLLAATSRAGLLSFGAVIVLGGVFALLQAVRSPEYRLNLLSMMIMVIATGVIAVFIAKHSIDFEMLVHFRDPSADRYGLDAMLYKLTVFDDGSTEERYGTFAFFIKELIESPLHFLSVGFGTGTFETMYGLNVHNSYLELSFTTGFVGFLVFVYLVVHVLARALSHPNAVKIVPVIFSLVSISVFMFAHDVLRGRIFWIALGVIAAFAYSHAARGRRVTLPVLPSINENSARYHWS